MIKPSKALLALLRAMEENGGIASIYRTNLRLGIAVKNRSFRYATHSVALQEGYVEEKALDTNPLHKNAVLTDRGRALLVANPPEPEPVGRLAITKPTKGCPPGHLVEIVRSTGKRHYVKRISGAQYTDYYRVVQGTPPNQYVAIEDICHDNVTREQYDRLVELHSEHTKWTKTVDTQMEDELRPIKERYEDRKTQKRAELNDSIRDILGG